jgi:oligopeptidase A
MQYATNRALRETLYRAYVTRASELGPPELDNTALMPRCWPCARKRRRCWATQLRRSVAGGRRWPQRRAEVLAFLRDLARALAPAERELAELRAFAARELACPTCRPGTAHCLRQRKLKQARYAFSSRR